MAKGKAAPAKKARTTRQRDWQPAFLAALRKTGLVTEACEAAGVGRQTVYDRRAVDEHFAAAWKEIDDRNVERLEAEAERRAVEGVESHKFDKDGNLLWTETKYSDTLLIFLLKAKRPATYRDNLKLEHSGPDGAPLGGSLSIDLGKLSDDELAQLQELTRKAGRRG